MKYQYEIVPKDDLLPIRFFYSNNQQKSYISPHLHDYVEVIYLLSGSLYVIVNGKSLMLSPDNLIIIQPNHIHATCSNVPTTTAYVLQISLSFLQQYNPNYEKILFDCILDSDKDSHQKLADVRTVLHDFQMLTDDSNAYCKIKRTSLLYDIIYLFSRYFSSSCQKQSTDFRPDTYTRLIQITDYIGTHFKEVLTLTDMALSVGLSPSYLSRFFKKHIGINFSEYLDMLRLDHAYIQVTTTRTPILKISEDCGFANYCMFVKKFQRAYGKTPLKLRQWHQVQEEKS